MSKRYRLKQDYGNYKKGHIFEPYSGVELADEPFNMSMVEEIKEPSDEKIEKLAKWLDTKIDAIIEEFPDDKLDGVNLARALLPHMKESFFEKECEHEWRNGKNRDGAVATYLTCRKCGKVK